jgi:hypothetical protein
MCANCLTNAEAAIGAAAFVAYAAKSPAHRFLAKLGLVGAPDPVAHDVRTVAFLRNLDLDPVEILGADAVAAAAAWTGRHPAPALATIRARLSASARPIGSQSLLITQ